GLEGERSTAAECAVQEEIQRPQIGQLEALDRPLDLLAEVRGDALGREMRSQHTEPRPLERDHADVRGVPLAAGARRRGAEEADPHAASTRTAGVTSRLSMRAGQ